MTLRICIAGVSGWVGKALATAILETSDLKLVGAISPSKQGMDVGALLGRAATGVIIAGDVETALQTPTDVFIDYTTSLVVKQNVLTALSKKVAVVIGTSGLTASDFEEIGFQATVAERGVVAAGNFALTAALLNHFALLASRYLPQREIIDYAHAEKLDVPSGTAQELAERMALIRPNTLGKPVSELRGQREGRGAAVAGTQVHSVRLPGNIFGFEALFGLPDERLSLRHDAGPGAEPYVAGTLLAARKACELKGLVRGLDTLLFP